MNTDFGVILKLNKKRMRRKIVAIALGSLDILSISAGTFDLIVSKNEPIGSFISGMVIATGILEIGGSIPIFISSDKKET